jgi:AcrR family transcriptional regulator
MSTRDRILNQALTLFNDMGVESTSTNHIAAALEMSPGNLYYHFRNKEAIIRELFGRLYDRWDHAFTLPEHPSPSLDDLQRLVHANFEIMWEFRFVYRELATLLRKDAELQAGYLQVRARGYTGFQELVTHFAAAGVLRPIDTETCHALADFCWLISEFWLPNLEISGITITTSAMAQGTKRMLQLFAPYLDPATSLPDAAGAPDLQ